MNLAPNQYYGYFDYDDIFDRYMPVFHVVLIKPANSKPKDWIGSKNVKLVDMLCIDDLIIKTCEFPIDWSKVNAKH